MKTADFIVLALLLCLTLLATVVYFSWLYRSFEGLGKRSTGPMPMTTAGYIYWTSLSLGLLAVAVSILWAAVGLLQQIEHRRAQGEDLFFVEEEQSHARSGALVGLLFGIGGILAGRVPLRAWRSRKR